ncbi:Lrp/AsnC family transcriptional regulator [Haladaptatus sp. NG-WS-4]
MSNHDLDETDLKILESIDATGEIDAEQLSERLDVSTSTVYYRVEQYREMGLFDGKIADLDPGELGFELTAITEIKSNYGPGYDDIADELSELSGVEQVYFMLGEMSFIVISKVRDHDHLQRLIDDIIHTDGVSDSATNIVLREFKNESRLLVNYDDADLQAIVE